MSIDDNPLLKAKAIEESPVLRGQDLIDFVESLSKKDSVESQRKRQRAYEMMKEAVIHPKVEDGKILFDRNDPIHRYLMNE